MDIWHHCCSRYHLGLYTMQELSYLGIIILLSIWFRIKLTQIMTWMNKDALLLTYPPYINIWLILQFGYMRVGTLMLIINTIHSLIYRTQHWLWPIACEYLMISQDRVASTLPPMVQLGHQTWENNFQTLGLARWPRGHGNHVSQRWN